MAYEKALTVQLTEMQAIVVQEVARGVPVDIACGVAGYADPVRAAWLMKHNPAVQAAVAQELRRFLYLEAAPAAMKVMYDFMVDKDLDKKLRLACAKTIADRAGYVPPKAKDSNGLEGKNVTEMSADEMREMAQRIQKELADRAVVTLDNAPALEAESMQAFDLLD